jgi:sulfofructose kinase
MQALADSEATIDILGLGVCAVDDLVYVSEYPPADAKTPVKRRDRQCGGLTMTALVAAARLGARCAYAGVLGEDPLSDLVRSQLRYEDIDVRLAIRRTGARPIHSTIVVGLRTGTRNIFFDTADVAGADPTLPDPSVIRQARVLVVDTYGIEGMIRASRVAREAGIPVVADFESADAPDFQTLLQLVDHLLLSRDFACAITGTSDAEAAAAALWHADRSLVVITDGARGGWFRDRDTGPTPEHYPALAVPTVDTTGCGDVFHGAYCAALAQGLDTRARLRLAAAAAALKSTVPGGQSGCPTLAEVEAALA